MILAAIFLAGAIWGAFVWHGIAEPVEQPRDDGADGFGVALFSFHGGRN